MTYSDAEKRVAAEQIVADVILDRDELTQEYRDVLRERLVSGRGILRASATLHLQCLLNRQQREIEEAVSLLKLVVSMSDCEGECSSDTCPNSVAANWLSARNTESK